MSITPYQPFPYRHSFGHAGTPAAAWRNELPIYFLTICAKYRANGPLLPHASPLVESACAYHSTGRWFLHLFLLMPYHVHLLVPFPPDAAMARTDGQWKHFLATRHGVQWQRNFIDHRLRNAAEFSKKWFYIRMNPVRQALVPAPDDWPHWVGYHPRTGMRLP